MNFYHVLLNKLGCKKSSKDLILRKQLSKLGKDIGENGYEIHFYYRNKANELIPLHKIESMFNQEKNAWRGALSGNIYRDQITIQIINKIYNYFKVFKDIIKNQSFLNK